MEPVCDEMASAYKVKMGGGGLTREVEWYEEYHNNCNEMGDRGAAAAGADTSTANTLLFTADS